MATIDNREAAIEAKSLYESYQAHMSSDWGKKLREKLKSIKDNSVDKSMLGSTPETHVFYESRGAIGAITQINNLFGDVEKDYKTAIAWLQANPPQEGTASEKTE